MSASVSVGEQLKQARSARGLSLKNVTFATKIQPWVLEALEADRLQATMSQIYVKSFLVNYAKFLRLDPKPLVAQVFPPPPPQPEPEPQPPPALAALDVAALRQRLVEAGRAWLPRVGPVVLGLAVLVVMVRLNPLKWVSARIPHTQASLSVMDGPATPSPKELALELEPTQPLELMISARRSTWVSVRSDGRLVTQRQLKGGEQEQWRARRRFELIIGAPAQVEITLNGHSIGPLAMAHHGRLLITHKQIASLSDSAQ